MKLEDNMAQDKSYLYKYHTEWDKKNTKQFKIKLVYATDSDIIEYLDSCPNKQGLIKDLLRQHIAKEKATD